MALTGTYFTCIMFMVASSCITTILILNYHHRLADTHEMPEWVQALFLQWIPWLLLMSRPGEKITRKTIMMANKAAQQSNILSCRRNYKLPTNQLSNV